MIRSKSVQKPPVILTNDPSITAWGWAIVTPNNVILEAGCIKTAPEHKKKRIRKGDDTVRRVHEVNKVLISLVDRYNVRLILSELPHGSQNASAAVMIGIVTGIVQMLADCYDTPIEWYSEGDSKVATLGKRAATKKEMIVAIDKLYTVPFTRIGYKDEAIADALSVYNCASQNSQILKFLQKV